MGSAPTGGRGLGIGAVLGNGFCLALVSCGRAGTGGTGGTGSCSLGIAEDQGWPWGCAGPGQGMHTAQGTQVMPLCRGLLLEHCTGCSSLPSPRVLGCDFWLGLPIRNEDLLLAPGMWLLGWRWEIAVEGLEMVPNPLLPSSLAGYAGGRLGGRQNLLAGALQRRRLPGGQLHFHRWDRLQGKSAAAGICQVSDSPCRGTPKRCSSCLKLLVPRPVSAAGRAPRAASGSGAI